MTTPTPIEAGARADLPWWAYILMLPLAMPGIVLAGYVLDTITNMVSP